MSYLIGNGWWGIWYVMLWLGVVPFVAVTAALARATPNDRCCPWSAAIPAPVIS